jgi:hypothetical protein
MYLVRWKQDGKPKERKFKSPQACAKFQEKLFEKLEAASWDENWNANWDIRVTQTK